MSNKNMEEHEVSGGQVFGVIMGALAAIFIIAFIIFMVVSYNKEEDSTDVKDDTKAQVEEIDESIIVEDSEESEQ